MLVHISQRFDIINIMKTFGYVCRDNNGVLKSGNVQAATRADAIRQIKAMGHVPVSVTEGNLATPNISWRLTRNQIVGVTVAAGVLIVGLTVWRFSNRAPVPANPTPAQIQTSSANSPRPAAPSVSGDETTSPAVASSIETPSLETLPEPHPQVEPPPRARPPSPTSQAATPETVLEEEQAPQRPNQFKNSTEQLLAMAMSAPPGAMIPPLPIPGNLDEDFINSLTNTIVIYDDDDERTMQLKESVAVAKNQMLELLKQGQSVADVLKEYQETANERATIRSQAQRELNALHRSGKPQEAQEYMEKINESFKDMDIEPIALPKPRNPK